MDNAKINIRGARTNNLKNISVDIPSGKLVVVTGLSGSGKSSLAFDTLYAEGQRRYVESLSSYARQFLGRMQKPDVDFIDGISPAIAIQQKTSSKNPRSTVGTSTEIYDYIRLLFARIGRTISPVSGNEVKRHQVQDVVTYVMNLPVGEKIMLLAPVLLSDQRTLKDQLSIWQQQGFTRLYKNGQIFYFSDINAEPENTDDYWLLVDRIVTDAQQTTANRFADSVQTAFFEGKGYCRVQRAKTYADFSTRFEADGITFIEPSEHLFDFNNPLGACPLCKGFGNIIGIDPDLVVPDKSKSIYEGAIACWHGEKMSLWKDELIANAGHFDFPIHTPFYRLTPEQKQLIWTGNDYFHGLNEFFLMLEQQQYAKIQYRVMLARYRGKTLCPECNGTRLRKEATHVFICGKNITQLINMSIADLANWFAQLTLTETELTISKQLLTEITSRLQFMLDVGLEYLTLNRLSGTLSGGESQRINLAKSLGSSLVGSLYVLDEPSVGLHPRDTHRLIKVLCELRELGNTVVVVEHDEDIMRAADYIIDIGPEAGLNGGKIVWQGIPPKLTDCTKKSDKTTHSYTLDFLTSKETIDIPKFRRPWNNYIRLEGVTENNLKNIDVRFPLNVITVVTGVSGSGKSSLVTEVLYPALKKYYGGTAERTGDFRTLTGSMDLACDIELVDQNPIGTSSRSNPVTYIKAYDEIRRLFSEQQLSKQMGYTPAHFSFNTQGGRCEECKGEGFVTVEMQFMADLVLECEHCHGKRFKPDLLDVQYNGKTIYDILEMTVNQAIDFFSQGTGTTEKKIVRRLRPLQDVGIGYIKLGQSSSTLSGGESQRIKLAAFLSNGTTANPNSQQNKIYIFDEPTTGLHFHDINVLLRAFNALVSKGNTVIIIEHNPAVIMAADHVIDLGPEAGDRGGNIVFEGTPEMLMRCADSHTGRYLCQTIKK